MDKFGVDVTVGNHDPYSVTLDGTETAAREHFDSCVKIALDCGRQISVVLFRYQSDATAGSETLARFERY